MKKEHNRVITGYETEVFTLSYANIFAKAITIALRNEGIEANIVCIQDRYRFNGVNRVYPTHYGIKLSNGKVFDCSMNFRDQEDFLIYTKGLFRPFSELKISNGNGLFKDVHFNDPVAFIDWALESGFMFGDSRETLIDSIPRFITFVKNELLRFEKVDEEETKEVLLESEELIEEQED